MYNDLDDLVNSFCHTCRNKKVNSESTVEDVIRNAYQCLFRNNVTGWYFMLVGVMATLKTEGGCQSCINRLQSLMDDSQK